MSFCFGTKVDSMLELGLNLKQDPSAMEKIEEIRLHPWIGNRVTEIISIPEEGCALIQFIHCFNS